MRLIVIIIELHFYGYYRVCLNFTGVTSFPCTLDGYFILDTFLLDNMQVGHLTTQTMLPSNQLLNVCMFTCIMRHFMNSQPNFQEMEAVVAYFFSRFIWLIHSFALHFQHFSDISQTRIFSRSNSFLLLIYAANACRKTITSLKAQLVQLKHMKNLKSHPCIV